jgi:hypothetical protein
MTLERFLDALRGEVSERLDYSPGSLDILEWLMVAKAPTFKRWGISAEQIATLRSLIPDVRFTPSGRCGDVRNGSP